jgi:glycosyltransferase involved in cell wall biosynthesis
VLSPGDLNRRFLSRLAALRESAQIAVADAVRASHVSARRIPPHRFVTIRNGIGAARFGRAATRADARRSLGLSDDRFVCLCAASLTRQKNHANLLRAAALLPADVSVTFLLAGGGPLAPQVEAAAAGLGGRVKVLGQRLDVPDLLAAADAFVLSSDWEGLPITLLEAMAAGVPAVVTDVGGNREVVRDGVDGFLVPPRDPTALARAVERLARDRALRARISAAARATFDARFTADGMVRQTEALYRLALSGRADLATLPRVKVLFVIGQLGYGGAERQLVELASRLPRGLFEPVACVLSRRGPLADDLERGGVRVICLNKRRGVLSLATWGLVRLVRSERPAVLHSYLFSGNWRGILVGRLLRVPLVVSSFRNVDIHSLLWMNVLERALACIMDRVIANAEAVKEYVSRTHWIPPQRIHVIHNGVAAARFTGRDGGGGARDATGRGTGAADGPAAGDAGARGGGGPVVAMLASLTPKKAPRVFIEAAALVREAVPSARFLVVGGGPLRADLEARARELGLAGAVLFTGETNDVPEVLAGVTVSVLTSVKEGCSNTVLETMAAGRPMVATAVGGNPELIADGVTGFLVPAGDARAVADRVVRLLTDPDLAARMGAAAKARAYGEFSVDRMVERTVAVYREHLTARVPGLLEWAAATAAREGGA